jgi:CspA family cold shock protein
MTLQGVVKTYDPTTGIGVVLVESDGTEAFLRPGSLTGSIFRFVRQGQRIQFEIETEGDKSFVVGVKVGEGGY